MSHSLPSVSHQLIEGASSAVKVSGHVWFDMMIATLVSGLLLQHLPSLITWCSTSFNKLIHLLLHSFFHHSDHTYPHTVTITSCTGDGNSNNSSYPYDDDHGQYRGESKICPTAGSEGADNLLMILGTLHFFQQQKIHFHCQGTQIGHVQPALTSKQSTRDRLLNAALAFIPTEPVLYQDMKFTFTTISTSHPTNEDQSSASSSSSSGKKKPSGVTHTDTMQLRVEGHSLYLIESFLQARLKEEVNQQYPDPDEDRGKQFMFELNGINSNQQHHNPYHQHSTTYLRSLYTTHKTFQTVFFEGKNKLLQTVHDFLHRTGAWSPGHERADKLIILLEGLPGTGKTSIVKALAHLTKRHLLLINAQALTSDAQLTRIFRDTHLTYLNPANNGGYITKEVPMSERLYVFEDLDCTGGADWLFARDDNKKKEIKGHKKTRKQLPNIESSRTIIDDILGGDVDHDEHDADDSSSSSETHSPISVLISRKKKDAKSSSLVFEPTPHPTLGGMLNVLDGVCELAGCIIVLSTNKAELFDKALFRAGRVDLRLTMSHINAVDLASLLEHYYETTLTSPQLDQISTLKSLYTASEIQDVCQHCLTVTECLQRL